MVASWRNSLGRVGLVGSGSRVGRVEDVLVLWHLDGSVMALLWQCYVCYVSVMSLLCVKSRVEEVYLPCNNCWFWTPLEQY